LFLFIYEVDYDDYDYCHFNTTLVFIYLGCCRYFSEKSPISIQHLFLFIAFYFFSLPYTLGFQYNTCFYLSDFSFINYQSISNFNTTLVFIYQNYKRRGNTVLWISIQHLFLFIVQPVLSICSSYKFQYNTCFYLSRVSRLSAGMALISIQHLFLFIEECKNKLSLLKTFQYNTCFYLSCRYGMGLASLELDFNTTLVFIYL